MPVQLAQVVRGAGEQPFAFARGQTAPGRSLLRAAADEAVARGLYPILDVAVDLEVAASLYESCGWTRVAEITVRFSDGTSLDEYMYLGPALHRPASAGPPPSRP